MSIDRMGMVMIFKVVMGVGVDRFLIPVGMGVGVGVLVGMLQITAALLPALPAFTA